jgi:hypothetical protein
MSKRKDRLNRQRVAPHWANIINFASPIGAPKQNQHNGEIGQHPGVAKEDLSLREQSVKRGPNFTKTRRKKRHK